jgi:hypothetical protein
VTVIRVPVAPSRRAAHLCRDRRSPESMRTPPRPVPATDRRLDAGADVVGVDEQRRRRAESLDLAAERVLLGVVQKGPRVRGGAHRGDAHARPPRGCSSRRTRRCTPHGRRRRPSARRPREPISASGRSPRRCSCGGGVRDRGVVVEDRGRGSRGPASANVPSTVRIGDPGSTARLRGSPRIEPVKR